MLHRSHRLRPTYVALAFALLSSATLAAQTTPLRPPSSQETLSTPSAPSTGEHATPGKLTLRVLDPSGAAIPNADIHVGAFRVYHTDRVGSADLTLPPGSWHLTISQSAFLPAERTVGVGSGQHFEIAVTLAVASAGETIQVNSGTFKPDLVTSATRTPMSVLETPQQVQSLGSDLLESRATDSMKQALELVPAVGIQLGEGRRDNFFLRGFNAVSDMYIDGVRDDAQYYRDLSNTDRLEILEGPAAVLYGRGSSGGLINRVTKKPRLEGNLADFNYTEGSYGLKTGSGDLDSVIPRTNRTLGVRLTGAAESTGSHRHSYWEDHYAFSPTLKWQPSEHTFLTAQIERLRDDRLPDRGIPYLPAGNGPGSGLPADVPVGNFYGYVGSQPGSNFIHSAVTDETFDLHHATSNGWQLRAVQHVAGYATNFANMYATAVTGSAQGYLVARGEYNGAQSWHFASTNIEGSRSVAALGHTHTLLLGAEFDREATDATQYTGPTNQTPINLFNPVDVPPVLSSTLSRNNRFLAQTQALYAQDLIQVGAHWKALVGVRFDDFRQTLELRPPTNITPNLGRTDYAASPRVGLVYSVRPNISVYGNYSRTFDPSGENLSLAANNAELQPEVTQNYEGGAKAELLQRRILLTSSVFRLDRTNIKTTDPNNPPAVLNLGEQRTDGAELNAQGSLTRGWQIFGGYAWLDGRIVSSTTLSNGVLLQGRRPAMTPLHSGSVWTTYTFSSGSRLRGLTLGGGTIAKSQQFASTDNLARLPGFGRLDAMAAFRHSSFELQANMQNLTDVRYYDAAQSDYQIYPAAPVSGSVTLRYHLWSSR